MSVTPPTMELTSVTPIVALCVFIIGLSFSLSMGREATGTESGYFQFCRGILLTLTGGVFLAQTVLSNKSGISNEDVFTNLQQFRQCLALFVPPLLLVMVVTQLGITHASGMIPV